MAEKKKNKDIEKKSPEEDKEALQFGCSFIFLVIFGLTVYKLYKFVNENISENALLALKITGISLLALFVAYVTFKIIKFIYYIGYNIFQIIDKKFSISEKYFKFTHPKTKKDEISSLQQEIEELKQKLADAQNNSNIRNITENVIDNDITEISHIIITNSTDKSISTNSIITNITHNLSPDKAKIILIDLKSAGFKVFEESPYLIIPIITDIKKTAGALNWIVNEMMKRYEKFTEIGVNDLKSYNGIAENDDETLKYPHIFIFINEIADIISADRKEIKDFIYHIARLGHTAGIHLVIAAQHLTDDVNRIFDFIHSQINKEDDSHIVKAVDDFAHQTKKEKVISESGFEFGSDDDFIIKGAEIAVNAGQLSTTMLQKKLKLGYARAVKIMDELEERGIIGPPEGSKPRKVLITREDYNNIISKNKTNNSLFNITYEEVLEMPEYKIIKEYVAKLKIVNTYKFVKELSPFDSEKTIFILGWLISDGTLAEYGDGQLLYSEYNSILALVDSMSENGIEFERFTAELLFKNGFTNIKLTQSSGDYGIDVLAEKDDVTYAIQCKCYSNSVGNKAVQEAYSGKDFYRCMVAVVFTNNYFTKSAIETARQNNVILWDRNKLIEFVKSLKNSTVAT